MKVLYFDCFSGISGDMALGALIDIGVPADDIIRELKKLNLDGWDIAPRRVSKNGIDCVFAGVTAEEPGHDRKGTAEHGHAHRKLADILRIIETSDITDGAKRAAAGIFDILAEAEGAVHGLPAREVSFHEVGALDSIIDVVGVAVAIDMLRPDKTVSSVVSDGRGFTRCRHGLMPVPVPAVVEIFSARGIASRQLDIDAELVTPTGAAILAYLCESFGPPPAMTIQRSGYGAGARDNAVPNCLRLCIGEAGAPELENKNEMIAVIETNIDDCSPEIVAYTAERLLSAGANDVFTTPIIMKKGRAGVKLSVLCECGEVDKMCGIILAETPSIGLRMRRERRVILPRLAVGRETAYGAVAGKKAVFDGREKTKAEFESAKRAALEAAVPLREVYRAFERAEEVDGLK